MRLLMPAANMLLDSQMKTNTDLFITHNSSGTTMWQTEQETDETQGAKSQLFPVSIFCLMRPWELSKDLKQLFFFSFCKMLPHHCFLKCKQKVEENAKK